MIRASFSIVDPENKEKIESLNLTWEYFSFLTFSNSYFLHKDDDNIEINFTKFWEILCYSSNAKACSNSHFSKMFLN